MITISHYLANDQARCDGHFEQLRRAALSGAWSEARRHFSDLSDALQHHWRMEEQVVFPAVERALLGFEAATTLMRREHGMLRGVLQRIGLALREQDRVAFFDHADTMRLAQFAHSEKEEGVLLPMIERVMPDEQPGLVAAMIALERVARADDSGANAP